MTCSQIDILVSFVILCIFTPIRVHFIVALLCIMLRVFNLRILQLLRVSVLRQFFLREVTQSLV